MLSRLQQRTNLNQPHSTLGHNEQQKVVRELDGPQLTLIITVSCIAGVIVLCLIIFLISCCCYKSRQRRLRQGGQSSSALQSREAFGINHRTSVSYHRFESSLESLPGSGHHEAPGNEVSDYSYKLSGYAYHPPQQFQARVAHPHPPVYQQEMIGFEEARSRNLGGENFVGLPSQQYGAAQSHLQPEALRGYNGQVAPYSDRRHPAVERYPNSEFPRYADQPRILQTDTQRNVRHSYAHPQRPLYGDQEHSQTQFQFYGRDDFPNPPFLQYRGNEGLPHQQTPHRQRQRRHSDPTMTVSRATALRNDYNPRKTDDRGDRSRHHSFDDSNSDKGNGLWFSKVTSKPDYYSPEALERNKRQPRIWPPEEQRKHLLNIGAKQVLPVPMPVPHPDQQRRMNLQMYYQPTDYRR